MTTLIGIVACGLLAWIAEELRLLRKNNEARVDLLRESNHNAARVSRVYERIADTIKAEDRAGVEP